jgi:hypothetical protein
LSLDYNVLGVALCLSALGELELATRVHGAADGLIEHIGQSFVNLSGKLRERDHSHLRKTMGEKRFEAAYSAGHLLTSSEAVALAELSIQRLLDRPRAVSPDVR